MSPHLQSWSKLLPALWLCTFTALAACSGSGSNGGRHNGDGADAGEDGGSGSGSHHHGGGDGDGGAGADAGADGGVACKTKCDPDDCGDYVSDLCGGHLVCRKTCPAGEGCGFQRPDKCDPPPPAVCTPVAETKACKDKCGIVSDGCAGVYTCTSKNGGISCGSGETCDEKSGSATANSCVTSTPLCTPLTCDQQHVECGQTTDGCGGVLDCSSAANGGGCTNGMVCGTGANSGKCVAPGANTCTPLSASSACSGTCGQVSDGCGGLIDCEATPATACPSGQTCGGGGTAGVCGSTPDGGASCTKYDQATVCANTCGYVPDGCGGAYNCSGTNGGGIVCDPNKGQSCVSGSCVAPACVPKTYAQACPGDNLGHTSCGSQSDGCNGTIQCGNCGANQTCGLAGPSLCGNNPACQPTPVATACSGKCGTVADGCGGTYTCSGTNGGVTCTGSEYCGATQANKCGTPVLTCTPKTCAQLGDTCGHASDGCGHEINCWPGCSSTNLTCAGSCGSSATCEANASGAQSCVSAASTCTGNLCSSVPTSCSASAPTKLTGTVITPGLVVNGTTYNQLPVPNAIVYIPGDTTTALPSVFEGVDPNNPASCGRCADEKLVATGQTILAAAVTDYKGQFTLSGSIPVNKAFNLVVMVGKWRRVVQVPATVVPTASACKSTALSTAYTRLAKNSTDGLTGTHLPKIAISTGKVDEMECVFRNMGIDEAEFTLPTGTGRIHMYRANGAELAGAVCSGTYVSGGNTIDCTANSNYGCTSNQAGCTFSNADSLLFTSPTTLDKYDLVVWDCEGYEHFESAPAPSNIETYVDDGGRMFASHFSYVWIEDNGTLAQSADWHMNGSANSDTGYISMPTGPTARPGANGIKSPLFEKWLDWQGALTGTIAGQLDNPTVPQFTIDNPRDRAGANVGASTDEWVYRDVQYCTNRTTTTCKTDSDCGMVCSNNTSKTCNKSSQCGTGGTCIQDTCNATLDARVQQLSFNTPYAAAETSICGRVAYSGFHVANASNNSASFFPAICSNGALSAQEKILAFMLFDLATCVSAGDPPAPPSCTAKTAAQLCPNANDACGYVSDGCGGVVDCAGCGSGYYCDGNTCKPQACTPETCQTLGFNCGQAADGCGGIALNSQGQATCGTCSGGQVCGLGGPGLCGTPSCTKIAKSTACPTNSCGLVSDGCGGTYDCGTCPTGDVCGGGGANLCGPGSCTKISQATACTNKNCGLVSDGCGGTYDCGSCTDPLSCGGGGKANVCGQPSCTPYTTTDACKNLQCGWVSDGCGGAINCGSCPNGGVCGGAGPNLCGGSCTPTTCTEAGAQCGAISDLCGSILQCGSCPSGETCGAAGPNKCGSSTCVPLTCVQAGAQCGLIGDGCGNVLDCGTCTSPATCGGAGVPNQCGVGTSGCNKVTCADQNVMCGAASDGCGGVLDCGGCQSGYSCDRGQCTAVTVIL